MKKIIIEFLVICTIFTSVCTQEKTEEFDRQQINYSKDKSNYIYTYFNKDGKQEVAIYKDSIVQGVRKDEFIKFNPVINDKGDFAYALSEFSTSESKIYLNNNLIKEITETGLYKSLAMNDQYLMFSYSRFYDNSEFIISYNLENQEINKVFFDGFIQQIRFITENKAIIEAYNMNNKSRDVYLFDVVKNKIIKEVANSPATELIKEVYPNGEFIVHSIEGTDVGKYVFNAYYLIDSAKRNSNFSKSNNFMGRLTWNEVYRLEAMIKLYSITNDEELKEEINNISKNIMENINAKYNLNSKYNPSITWATTKYSIDKTTPISLIVDDSLIFYALLQAVNANLIEDTIVRDNIVNNAQKFYEYQEKFYNKNENLYKIPYGIEFHVDGLEAPFNWQNSFGLMSIELYKFSNNEKYKDRVFQLAKRFKSEMKYTSKNRLIWHYWPEYFYRGWKKGEMLSKNYSAKNPERDDLYEDFSHAGLNLKFILEFKSNFGDEIFSDEDIKLINNTLDNMILENNKFSRFISGDIEYQSPSFIFIPKYGWTELYNFKLKNYYSNLLPLVYPEFDSQELALSYVNLIKDFKVNDKIIINSIKYNSKLKVVDSKTKEYKFNNIKNYFKEKL